MTELERFYITESDRLPLATKQPNQLTAPRQGLHLRRIVKNGTELALALTYFTSLALSTCAHTAKLPDHTIATCPTRPAPTNASAASPSPQSD